MTHPARSGDQDHATDEALGVVPAAIKLRRILGTNPASRMLTPYEVDLLRQSEREIVAVVRKILQKAGAAEASATDAKPGGVGPQAEPPTC